jgi:cytoskeletal protein CcmA (bactofilin family)
MRGKTLSLKGELRATEDMTIEGRVEGSIHCDGFAVVLAASAHVTGDVLARDITVLGRGEGQLTATDIVDVRAGAYVTGRIVSKRVILDAGATFNGRIEPQHLEAALRVADFQRRKREDAS